MCLRRLIESSAHFSIQHSPFRIQLSDMPYFYNTPDYIAAMLQAIGVRSIEELFASLPDNLRLKQPLNVPPALSEMELAQHLQSLAAKNSNVGQKVCFLGGGAYDHFVPAVVDAIASRGEFFTSYTPY